MSEIIKLKMPPLRREWVRCPHCGAKTVLYDNTANCSGVHIKCTRGCKREFELKIINGKQVH